MLCICMPVDVSDLTCIGFMSTLIGRLFTCVAVSAPVCLFLKSLLVHLYCLWVLQMCSIPPSDERFLNSPSLKWIKHFAKGMEPFRALFFSIPSSTHQLLTFCFSPCQSFVQSYPSEFLGVYFSLPYLPLFERIRNTDYISFVCLLNECACTAYAYTGLLYMYANMYV